MGSVHIAQYCLCAAYMSCILVRVTVLLNNSEKTNGTANTAECDCQAALIVTLRVATLFFDDEITVCAGKFRESL